jgi:hypothetical protein
MDAKLKAWLRNGAPPDRVSYSRDPEINADVTRFVGFLARRCAYGGNTAQQVESGHRHAAWLQKWRDTPQSERDAQWRAWQVRRLADRASVWKQQRAAIEARELRRAEVEALRYGPAVKAKPLRTDAYGRPALDLEHESVDAFQARCWRHERGIVQ